MALEVWQLSDSLVRRLRDAEEGGMVTSEAMGVKN